MATESSACNFTATLAAATGAAGARLSTIGTPLSFVAIASSWAFALANDRPGPRPAAPLSACERAQHRLDEGLGAGLDRLVADAGHGHEARVGQDLVDHPGADTQLWRALLALEEDGRHAQAPEALR